MIPVLLLLCGLAGLHTALAVSCPGLGVFDPVAPFEGWPDPTCPGDIGLDLVFKMFNRRDLIGHNFDRSDVPFIFDPNERTIFLIHDHGENVDTQWLQDMMTKITDVDNINVVIVGWGGVNGAEDSNYWRAASDTRTVGAETAEVMMNLVIGGGGAEYKMEFVGFGLGAHVAGHAGRWAANAALKPDKLKGLDPAGPHFSNNSDRTVGMYTDCASQVEVIHTDQVYGSTPLPGAGDLRLGDEDYFVNDGSHQPWCAQLPSEDDACDHKAAVTLYMDTIVEQTYYYCTADMECTDSSAIPSSCSPCDPCASVGYHWRNNFPGRYTLTTAHGPPYC